MAGFEEALAALWALQEDKYLRHFVIVARSVQSTGATGKTNSIKAAIPQSLKGSELQHHTCTLQVRSWAAALVASLVAPEAFVASDMLLPTLFDLNAL